jgi:hypothetical protein
MPYVRGRRLPIGTCGARAYSAPHVLAGTSGRAARAAGSVVKERVMSFALYLLGFAVLTGGIAWGLVTAGVPHLYVAIACVILVGVGILTGVARTRTKD